MAYISLLNNTKNLVELLTNKNITIQEICIEVVEKELTMKDVDKANKIIYKQYGKKNISYHKFPVDLRCEYAATAHNQCLCLYTYIRPNF